MLAAVTMVADGIRYPGSVALQARGTGPLTTLLAECRSQHMLRGIARWPEDTDVTQSLAGSGNHEPAMKALLGDAKLALTLIPEPSSGRERQPYQGLVSVAEGNFAGNLERYFAESEQLPTRLYFSSSLDAVTGLLLQRLPQADSATEIDAYQADLLWEEVQVLADTVRPSELAELAPDSLLRRLFASHTLKLHPPRALTFSCTCSRTKTSATLKIMPAQELLALLEERGDVEVSCEVCGAAYRYDAVDVHLLLRPVTSEPPAIH
jgi:molecular chaperone Hsp33